VTPRPGPAMALAAAATALGAAALRRWPPGGESRWRRTNHRGEPVTLLEGPALVLGATVGLLAAPGVPGRARAGGAVALLTAGALGAYDDLAGDAGRKGLAGHLGALARGELTTGAVKLLGLAATGALAAAVTSEADPAGRLGTTGSGVVDMLIGGAVVAGSANLLNLLDLRPGRALKVVLLTGPWLLAGASTGPAAAVLGSAAVLLPADLRERSMLGDSGANAAGAALGVAALSRLGRPGRAAVLAVLVGLTVTSERVSFTRVIESTPGLRELDRLGRRAAARPIGSAPAPAPGPPSAPEEP
jgi:UDP-N-acetylmuramyl pentapeptide phosphotransferase/UDP-N-acetylglucosamine-1-phosphate transferase